MYIHIDLVGIIEVYHRSFHYKKWNKAHGDDLYKEYRMSEHVDVSNIKDPTIATARKEVEFQRAMNPCPIDFSEFQSSNPRSQGEQKGFYL